MRLTNTFHVARHPDHVWAMFSDVPSVAQCLPGAMLTSAGEDGTYTGSIEVKLGPMVAKFEGTATVARSDDSRSGHIEGKGVDRRGGNRGQVKVDYAVIPSDSGTAVTVDADVTLSGAIAQFGRSGLIDEMTKRLIGEFVECLEAKMSAGTAEEAQAIHAGEVRGFTLFVSGLFSWIGEFFKRLFGRSGR